MLTAASEMIYRERSTGGAGASELYIAPSVSMVLGDQDSQGMPRTHTAVHFVRPATPPVLQRQNAGYFGPDFGNPFGLGTDFE